MNSDSTHPTAVAAAMATADTAPQVAPTTPEEHHNHNPNDTTDDHDHTMHNGISPHTTLVRTTTEASTTTTLYHPTTPTIREPPVPAPPANPTAIAPPPPDIIAILDPASAGGGGPLVRIATAHSARSLARERSRSGSGAAVRPSLLPLPLTRIRRGSRAASSNSASSKLDPDAEVEPAVTDKFAPVFAADNESGSDRSQSPSKDVAGDPEKAEKNQTASAAAEHVYPDGGYGWVVVACCTTLSCTANGWGMTWGLYQQYYADNMFQDVSTGVLSFGGAMQGFCMGATAFMAGRVGDRYGFKRVLFISSFIAWLGLFAASFSHALWSIILCQGVITGCGQGLGMPIFMSLPSQWFYKRRGLASGITMGGAGLGGGVSTLVVRKLLTVVGASKSLLIMSFVNLILNIAAITLIRTRPTSPEAASRRGPLINVSLFKHSEFWSIALSLLIGIIGYNVPFTFITQYTAANFPALSPMGLAAPLTIMGFSVIVGRTMVGYTADKLGALNTYIFVLVFSGVVQLSLWLTARTYAAICVFAVFYGLIAPGYLGILPQIIVTLFGPTQLASNVGLLLLFNSPGNLVAGPLGGAIYDASGRTTFKWMIVTMAVLQVVGGLIACWARFRTSPALLARV